MSGPATNRGVTWPGLGSWCVLTVAAVALCWPLIGNPRMPRASDISYHSQRAHGFTRALSEGTLYPRWLDETNRGFGGPDFIIYPPLSYYLVAACSLATSSVVEAIRLTLFAGAFLSGLSFFLAMRGIGSELGAAVGSALYSLLPYHALDLYDRFALAEYLAFIFFPLIFWSARLLAERFTWAAWFGLAGSFAGLILTHLMSGYMIAFLLGPYLLVRLAQTRRWWSLAPMAAAVLVAALCCAVYLVPFLVQRQFVHLDWFDTPHYDWRRNFIYRDEVAFGYKFDVVKPWSTASTNTQAFLVFVLAGLLALQHWGARAPGTSSNAETGRRREGWTHFGLALWAWYLQTPLSTLIWETVPQLGASQFPWRFSQFQLFSACCLAVSVLGVSATRRPELELPSSGQRAAKAQRPARKGAQAAPNGEAQGWMRRLVRAPGWLTVLIALAAIPALRVSNQLTSSRSWDFDERLAQNPAYRYRVVKEFFPRGAEGWQDWESKPYPERRSGLRTTGEVEEVAWTTETRHVRVKTPEPNRLVLVTFDYPGWQATVDGQPAPILSDSPANVIEVEVPAGTHEVEVVFTPTWDRRLGASISAASVLLVLGLAIWAWRRNRG